MARPRPWRGTGATRCGRCRCPADRLGFRSNVRYLLKRIFRLIGVLFAVSLITFLSTNLLGSPACSILGPECADKKAVAKVRHDLHLDDSVPARYVKWLGDTVHGD